MSEAQEQPGATPMSIVESRFGTGVDPNLRSRTARGTIVNAAFLIGTNALGLVRALAVAGILTTSQFGVWGLMMSVFMTVILVGSVGIGDKYVQQDDPDQTRAFEVAFTIQCVLGAVLFGLMVIAMPLFALLYDAPAMVAPGLVLALGVPAMVLQLPLRVHYRRLDFMRQRTLQAIDPVLTLIATVALALAGFGVWALAIGALIGTWSASAAIVWTSPYKLRWRWDRAAAREYLKFSGPLFLSVVCGALLIQVPVTVSSRTLGVTAVAGLALAGQLAMFTSRVDNLITTTLYPAICAVKDRADLLFESFWKSNRLAVLWAAPLGAAAAVFAGDFVHFVIGEKWRFAVPLFAVYGINAAVNQIGFNWTAFFRAVGDTKPIATASVIALLAVLAIPVPLLATEGLTAFGYGLSAATVIGVAVRMFYLRRIFPGLPFVSHVLRGIGPTLPAVAAVLAVRALDPGPRSAARVIAEVVLFAALVICSTALSERKLLRESVGYLRGVRFSRPAPAA